MISCLEKLNEKEEQLWPQCRERERRTAAQSAIQRQEKRENRNFCPILHFQAAAVNGAAGWPQCPAGEAAKGEGILRAE